MKGMTTGKIQVESGAVISEPLNLEETEILNLVSEQQPVSLEALSDRIDEVRHLISLCHLGLSVAAYPWGVQFELGLSKKGAAYVDGIRKATTDAVALVLGGR